MYDSEKRLVYLKKKKYFDERQYYKIDMVI